MVHEELSKVSQILFPDCCPGCEFKAEVITSITRSAMFLTDILVAQAVNLKQKFFWVVGKAKEKSMSGTNASRKMRRKIFF